MTETNNTEIIHKEEENSLGLKPEEKDLWVIQELKKLWLIEHAWGLDAYSAHVLMDIIQNAVAPDNKWELHIDFRTKLRWLELLLKLQNNTFGKWNDVNVNFFATPKTLRH